MDACLLHQGVGLVDVAVALFFQLLDELLLPLGLLTVAADLVFQGFFVLLEELYQILLFLR